MAETLPDSTLDRSTWPPGPWDAEPEDRLEWRSRGFPCLMVRNTVGAWCGYVGVPPGHPAYDQGYSLVEVQVHGGLTYGARCAGHICHVPQPGEPEDVYWLGFDCAHGRDRIPGMEGIFGKIARETGATYRDKAYVQQQVDRLAAQVAALARHA